MQSRKVNQTERAVRKAEAALQEELWKQYDIVYSCASIVFWRDYGWRTSRIHHRFATTQKCWDECAEYGTKKSMMEMLEDETGIELQIAGFDKSYHELKYLDASKWDGTLPTLQERIYMLHNQKKWVAPQVLACMCLSLHRDEGWGAERIARFIQLFDQERSRVGMDRRKALAAVKEVTGVDSAVMVKREWKS